MDPPACQLSARHFVIRLVSVINPLPPRDFEEATVLHSEIPDERVLERGWESGADNATDIEYHKYVYLKKIF